MDPGGGDTGREAFCGIRCREYEIPVVITAAVKEIQQQEEEPLPEERASAEVKQELKKGPGRSEDWKRRRSGQKIMAAFLMELERERRGDSSVKKALQRYRTLVRSASEGKSGGSR